MQKKQFESKLARDIKTNPKSFLHMLGQSLRLRIVLDRSKIVMDSWCQGRRKCVIYFMNILVQFLHQKTLNELPEVKCF